MERAYIYMQLPDSDEVVSLGALNTMAGYEEALCDHYRSLLADEEAELAIAAIGAFRLRE